MTREEALKLAEQDSSSDYCEGTGPYGGWYSVTVSDGSLLTVSVTEDDPDGLRPQQSWSWKLVPVI